MPTYSLKCNKCEKAWERVSSVAERNAPCDCGGEVEQQYVPNNFRTFGDDIPGGMWIENLGPHPVKVYSHTERLNLMRKRGLIEIVRHVGVPGSDRSPHTSSFDLPPIGDPRPMYMLSAAEQRERREEAAKRLGMTVEELESVTTGLESVKDVVPDSGVKIEVTNTFAYVGDGEDVRNVMEIIDAVNK